MLIIKKQSAIVMKFNGAKSFYVEVFCIVVSTGCPNERGYEFIFKEYFCLYKFQKKNQLLSYISLNKSFFDHSSREMTPNVGFRNVFFNSVFLQINFHNVIERKKELSS